MLPPLLIAALLACASGGGPATAGDEGEDTAFDDSEDRLAPTIEHTPVESPQSASGYVSVTATILDDSAIVNTTVYYRRQVEVSWSTVQMTGQGPDIYVGVLGPEELSSAGMHYYIEAVDQYGNVGTYPEGAPSDFLKFDLVE